MLSDAIAEVLNGRTAYDGDSTFAPGGGTTRAVGFDAPEMSPYVGGAGISREVFQQVLNDPATTGEQVGTDRYGRPLMEYTRGDQPVADIMLQTGAAQPFGRDATPEQITAARAATARQNIPSLRTSIDEAILADRRAHPAAPDFSAAPVLPESRVEGDWSRALDRGMANLQAAVGGAAQFVGERFGVDTTKEWGRKQIARAVVTGALNPAAVESFEDAETLSEYGTWALETLGENVANVASIALGGVAGAGGRLALAGIGKSALKTAANAEAKRAIRNQLMKSGARAGAVAAAYPQHLGEGALELKDAGIDGDETVAPFLTAAINTALDVAPMEAVLRYSFRGLKPTLARDLVKKNLEVLTATGVISGIAKGLGKGAATGALLEAPTEMTQELVNMSARAYHDPTFDWGAPEVAARLKEAALAGGVVGAAFGGAGRGAADSVRLINQYLDQAAKADPIVEPDEPAPGEPAPDAPVGGVEVTEESGPLDVEEIEAAPMPTTVEVEAEAAPGEVEAVEAAPPPADYDIEADIERAAIQSEPPPEDLNVAVEEVEELEAAPPPENVDVDLEQMRPRVEAKLAELFAQGKKNAAIAAEVSADWRKKLRYLFGGRSVTQALNNARRALPVTVEQTAASTPAAPQVSREEPPPVLEAPIDPRYEEALYDIAVKENYNRLDDAGKVLAYARMARTALERLRAVPEEQRTEQQDQLYQKLESDFNQNAAAAFDWDSLFDGVEATPEQRAELQQIVSAPESPPVVVAPAAEQSASVANPQQVALSTEDSEQRTPYQILDEDTRLPTLSRDRRAELEALRDKRDWAPVRSGPRVPRLAAMYIDPIPQQGELDVDTGQGPVDEASTATIAEGYLGQAQAAGLDDEDLSGAALDERQSIQSGESFTMDPIVLVTRRTRAAKGETEKAVRVDEVLTAREGIVRFLNVIRNHIVEANPGMEAPEAQLRSRKDMDVDKRREEVGDTADETVTLEVLNNGAPVFTAVVTTMLDAKTKGHGIEVNITLPPEGMRGGLNFKLLRSMVQSIWSGTLDQDGMVVMVAPDGKGVRFNLTELVTAGQYDLGAGERESAGDTVRMLLSGISWLVGAGFSFKPGQTITPNTKVGYGKHGTTWGKVRRAKDYAATDFEPLLREMTDDQVQAAHDQALVELATAMFGGEGAKDPVAARKAYEESEQYAQDAADQETAISKARKPMPVQRAESILRATEREAERRQLDLTDTGQQFDASARGVPSMSSVRSATPAVGVSEAYREAQQQVERLRQQVQLLRRPEAVTSQIARLLLEAIPPSATTESLERQLRAAEELAAKLAPRAARGQQHIAATEMAPAEPFDPDETELGDNAEGPESEENTNRFETDDQQARASAKAPGGRSADASPALRVLARSDALRRDADLVRDLLVEAGVTLIDPVELHTTETLGDMIAEMREAYQRAGQTAKRMLEADPKADVESLRLERGRLEYNAGLLQSALAEVQTARVVFLAAASGNAYPVIVLGPKIKTQDAKAKALLHETGHVVMRHFLVSATPEAKAEMQAAWGEPGTPEFEEGFADAFMHWALSHAGIRSIVDPTHARVHDSIKSFFGTLADALRKLWVRARKLLKAGSPYSEFIELLVNRRRRDRGEREYQPKTEFGKKLQQAMVRRDRQGNPVDVRTPMLSLEGPEFLNLTVPQRAAAMRKAKELLDNTSGGQAAKTVAETMAGFWDSWLRGYDTVVRRMKNETLDRDLADHFHRRPGTQTTGRPRARFDDEVRGLYRPIEDQIIAIAEGRIPKFRPWHLLPYVKAPEPSPEMQRAMDLLVAEGDIDANNKDEAAQIARQVRDVFEKLYSWLRAQGVYVPHRRNYFPVAMDVSKLFEQGSKDRVVEIVTAWSRTPEAQAWWEKRFGVQRLDEATQIVVSEVPPNFVLDDARAKKFAEHLYAVWTGGNASMTEFDVQTLEGGIESVDFMSPGFQYAKQRVLPRELIAALSEFRERDLVQLMTSYSRAAIKRGVWQSRFGSPKGGQVAADLARIADAFEQARQGDNYDLSGERWAAAFQLRDQLKERYDTQYGVSLYDPSAQLKVNLVDEVRAGRLSQEDYDRLTNEIIPGYMGMLGADFSIGGKPRPGFKRMAQLMMVYQAMRVLSMAVLAQFVDVGMMAARVRTEDWGVAFSEALRSLHGAGRQERLEAGRLLGLIQHDITDHILNDEAGVLRATRNISRANEMFFRYNGMHAFTNFTRSVDMMIAKRLIESWARTGSADPLGEIGITLEQAQAWVDAGKPLEWRGEHDAVLGGINQFIDESIVRPGAAIRPRLGNDQRFGLVWHLKSFMYGFQYMILDRVWNQAKQRWGEERGTRKMLAALPALMLAAWTLPFAALGMELRWLIAPPKKGAPEGWDYAFEAIQRSGLLGMQQFVVDMHETEQHGKFSALALSGPTVSQLYDYATKDLINEDGSPSSTLVRSLPAYPLLGWAAGAMRE